MSSALAYSSESDAIPDDPFLLVARTDFPASQQFAAYAKANQAKLQYASGAGSGGGDRLIYLGVVGQLSSFVAVNKHPSEHLDRATRLRNQHSALMKLRELLAVFDPDLIAVGPGARQRGESPLRLIAQPNRFRRRRNCPLGRLHPSACVGRSIKTVAQVFREDDMNQNQTTRRVFGGARFAPRSARNRCETRHRNHCDRSPLWEWDCLACFPSLVL